MLAFEMYAFVLFALSLSVVGKMSRRFSAAKSTLNKVIFVRRNKKRCVMRNKDIRKQSLFVCSFFVACNIFGSIFAGFYSVWVQNIFLLLLIRYHKQKIKPQRKNFLIVDFESVCVCVCVPARCTTQSTNNIIYKGKERTQCGMH